MTSTPPPLQTNDSGLTALHAAAYSGNVATIDELLANGADPSTGHAKNVSLSLRVPPPCPPLTDAKRCLCLCDVYLLFSAAPPPSLLALAHAQSTYTALHEACYNGHKLVVARLLVAKGELWSLKDAHGTTPVDMARMCGKKDIATAIELWGSGDHAGALQQLGYTGGVPATPPPAPPSSSSAASAVSLSTLLLALSAAID